MSARNNESNTTILSNQFNHTGIKNDSINEHQNSNGLRSDELNSDERYTVPDNIENDGSFNESGGEGYNMYPEAGYEEEFEVYKNNNKKFQWSRSILEEDAYPETILTATEARKCLNRIGQVGSGFLYAYIQIDVNHRNLTNIEEMANFKYLSLINVSHNRLDLNSLDVLRHLEYVVVIHADHNVVNSLCLSTMPYLQVLTLNSNRVSSLSGLKQPSLVCLELNDNQVSSIFQEEDTSFDGNCSNQIGCPNLSTLALSKNALETVEQLEFISIKLNTLYLSYNNIDNLKGLDGLTNLSHLHLRANRISILDGFTGNLKHLSYLNLRENRLHDVNELLKLVCLKSLKTLVVSQNEFNRIALKSIVLKRLPWLERIDKETVNESDVTAAMVYGDDESAQLSEELYENE